MLNERLTLGWYVSEDGACWTHLILWIAKDMAWLQCWLWASTAIAILGSCLSMFMIYRNACARQWISAVSETGVLLWLYGNAEWMYGECRDFTYNVTDPEQALDERTTEESAAVLWATGAIFASLCIVRFFRRRFWCWSQRRLSLTAGEDADFDGDELQPHRCMLGVFPQWCDYEEFHNLTWLCCDLSWNLLNAGFWWPAATFTLLIAMDATSVSSRVRGGAIDTAHYVFQMVWVISNCIWVYGDLYTNQDNQDPEIIISIMAPTPDAWSNFRFLSSIVCLVALLMSIVFHVYWACSTLLQSMPVPRRIQFLLSLEDDGLGLQTYRRFDQDSFSALQYDRISPPNIHKRSGDVSLDASLNMVDEVGGGTSLDASHSPPINAGVDLHAGGWLKGSGKMRWGGLVTPPPTRHAAGHHGNGCN